MFAFSVLRQAVGAEIYQESGMLELAVQKDLLEAELTKSFDRKVFQSGTSDAQVRY